MTDDSKYTRQTVTQVHTWVPDKLFSVRVTRDEAYTFPVSYTHLRAHET